MALRINQMLQILRDPECPRVLTTGDLMQWIAMSKISVSTATLKRWLSKMRESGLLKTVRRGLYLNALAHPAVQPDEAAAYICRGAIVSLQKVLGDVGVLNNFTSWVTCVVPLPPEKNKAIDGAFGFTRPSTGRVETAAGIFTFQAMPFDLIHCAGVLDDCLEQGHYQRATPEKAFLDWLYLGTTPRSHTTLPPLDLDYEKLDPERLCRLAGSMGLNRKLQEWQVNKASFDNATGTQWNAPTR